MITVTLNEYEVAHANWIAKARQRLAERDGRSDTYGYDGDGLAIHQDGCMAELAVAKLTGLYWHALLDHEGRQTVPDVGTDIEVRSCAAQHRLGRQGNLILHPKDRDNRCFILVDGVQPDLIVVGYIMGRDGKDQQWWKETDRPAYFVPREELKAVNA